MTTPAPARERQLGLLLLVGIVCVPAVFCWLLLRAGYRRSLRRSAFTYGVAMTLIGIVGHLG